MHVVSKIDSLKKIWLYKVVLVCYSLEVKKENEVQNLRSVYVCLI